MRRSGVSVLSNFMLEHFGKRFKQWLTERGVTLMDVAKDLRISYTNIYSFGAPPPLGRMPGPENAGLIAEYLGVPREEFFSAMGQIDPLLLEKVTPEEVEAGFLKLHEWLKRSDAKSVVEDERKRRWQRLYEKAKDLDDDSFELLIEHVLETADMLKKVRRREQELKESERSKAKAERV